MYPIVRIKILSLSPQPNLCHLSNEMNKILVSLLWTFMRPLCLHKAVKMQPLNLLNCTRVTLLSRTRTCYTACIACLYLHVILHDDMYPNPSYSSLPQQFASQPHLHLCFLKTRMHNQTLFEIEKHLPNLWPLEQIEQILAQSFHVLLSPNPNRELHVIGKSPHM